MSKATNDVSFIAQSIETQRRNLAGKNIIGFKEEDTSFYSAVFGKDSSCVLKKTRRNFAQGNIIKSDIKTHMAIKGANGMFVVANNKDGGQKELTRMGNFTPNKNGYLENVAGKLLMAWKLDENGNLPAGVASNSLDSLEPVKCYDVKGDPKATTAIALSMNLDGSKNVDSIRGNGLNASLQTSRLNGITGRSNSNDIIIPEQLGINGAIRLGDEFTFKSGSHGHGRTITYGGIAISNIISEDNSIYGSTNYTSRFEPISAENPNGIQEGAKIQINNTFFTYSSANPTTSDGKFNSFKTLVDAINKTGKFVSRVATHNDKSRIYIAPRNPNHGLRFSSENQNDLLIKLGLFNVKEANEEEGINRFYSLQTMKEAVNADSKESIKATTNKNTIKITSKLAQDDFKLTGNSFGKREFTTIIKGGKDEKTRGGIKILSPDHGLKTGDLVRINSDREITSGIYAVGKFTKDNFEIFRKGDPTNNEIFPEVINDANNELPVISDLNASWQKIPGFKSKPVEGARIISAISDGNIVTIRQENHSLAEGDVIYVSGIGKRATNDEGDQTITIPDGYYSVTQANMEDSNFTIAVTNVSHNVENIEDNVELAGNFTYQKIGRGVHRENLERTASLGSENFILDFPVIEVLDENKVKIFTSDTNYSVNDFITFNGLDEEGIILGAADENAGILLKNKTRYKVTSVNKDDGYITFEVEGGDAANNDENHYVKTHLSLGNNFNINKINQSLKYLGDQGENTGDLTVNYGIVYNPNEEGKSLKTLINENKVPRNSLLAGEVSVYTTKGEKFPIECIFAKLDKNRWAFTTLLKNSKLDDRSDGQIGDGEIFFDEETNEFSYSTLNDLEFNRDGQNIKITIDWESSNITQYADKYDIEPTQQNGKSFGTLLKDQIFIDKNGNICASFDNGDIKKTYRVPLGTVTDMNGLKQISGNAFIVTHEAGDVMLKSSGQGTTKIFGGALEESNVDTTEQLMTAQETGMRTSASMRAKAIKDKELKDILAETHP